MASIFISVKNKLSSLISFQAFSAIDSCPRFGLNIFQKLHFLDIEIIKEIASSIVVLLSILSIF